MKDSKIGGIALIAVNLFITPLCIGWFGERHTVTIGLSIAVLYTLGFALGLVKSVPFAYAITIIQDVSYGKV